MKFRNDASLFTVACLGPQSSGKSSLLKSLGGCGASYGRYSRGLYGSIVTTKYYGAETMLLLDTRGLLFDKSGFKSDNQMALLSMVLSCVVLIYIEEEVFRTLMDVISVAVYALICLKLAIPKLKLLFVFRDTNKQIESQIENTLRKVCDLAKVNLEDILDFSFILNTESRQRIFELASDNVKFCNMPYWYQLVARSLY